MTTRPIPRALVATMAAAAMALAACGGDTDTAGEAAETTAPDAAEEEPTEEAPPEEESGDEEEPAEEEPGGTTVAVTSSDLGDILVDGDGMTLYAFLPDEGADAPTCTDDCAQAWPVLEAPATAGEGADAGLLATVEHPSGVTQATYGDWPLYHFANDAQPGDTNGQGIGDNWYVVSPDGEPIQDTAAQDTTGY